MPKYLKRFRYSNHRVHSYWKAGSRMINQVSQSAAESAAHTQPPFGAEMLFRYALWYHELGINVVPLERPEKGKTKKPTCLWKGWQTKRQDRKELAALHNRTTHDNEPHWQ